jgi:sulfur-oxidizing protein SoxY
VEKKTEGEVLPMNHPSTSESAIMKATMPSISRRDSILLGFALVLAGTDWLQAAPNEVAAEITKFTGERTPEVGKIALDLPEIAENGNAVPLAVRVESPMTTADHVTDVLVVADGNPRPIVAVFQFTPLSGRAEAATRIRLAGTQNVAVFAKTSAGALLTIQKQVKVTIGGCGG